MAAANMPEKNDPDNSERPGAGTGLGVDSAGDPAVDPTRNVLDLVRAESKYQDYAREAEVRRQDDLRLAGNELNRIQNATIRDLTAAETRRLDDLATLRQQYDIRISENLSVQVKTTSDLISTQLDKVTSSLSTQIRDGNDAFASQLKAIGENLGARISDLEKFRWEVGGKTSVSDPATTKTLADLAAAVGALSTTDNKTEGKSEGYASVGRIILGVGSLISVAIVIAGFAIKLG